MEDEKFSKTAECKRKGQKVTRALWLIAGMICLVLGAIGIALPILPTTPFLLASAACFCKSSPRMYNWLLNNKWFGEYIRNYREGRGLQMKTKITALTFLWTTIGFSTFFLLDRLLPPQLVLPMQLIMLAVAIGVSIHILRLPTFKKRMLGGSKEKKRDCAGSIDLSRSRCSSLAWKAGREYLCLYGSCSSGGNPKLQGKVLR